MQSLSPRSASPPSSMSSLRGGRHQCSLCHPEWRSLWLFFNTIRRRVDNRQAEPRGVGGEVGALIFMQEVWFQASGACAWWGEFAKFGDIPLLMAGGKITLKLHESESDVEAV